MLMLHCTCICICICSYALHSAIIILCNASCTGGNKSTKWSANPAELIIQTNIAFFNFCSRPGLAPLSASASRYPPRGIPAGAVRVRWGARTKKTKKAKITRGWAEHFHSCVRDAGRGSVAWVVCVGERWSARAGSVARRARRPQRWDPFSFSFPNR